MYSLLPPQQAELSPEAIDPQITMTHIPDGDDGIQATVEAICQIVDEYSIDWNIISLAREITSDIPERDDKGESDALFYFVKGYIKFVNDPLEAELLQSPFVTLGARAGDCDDMIILLACLHKAIGNDVGYVTISQQNETEFVHILLAVFDRIDPEKVYYYDPATGPYAGWVPPNPGRVRLWYSGNEYQDLAGILSKIKKKIKKYWRKIRKKAKRILRKAKKTVKRTLKQVEKIARKIRDEAKRVAKRIEKEARRVRDKISAEIKKLKEAAKLELKMAEIASKKAELEVKRTTRRIEKEFHRVSERIARECERMGRRTGPWTQYLVSGWLKMGLVPWEMEREEWMALAEIAKVVGSVILTVVSLGHAAPLLAVTAIQMAMAAYDAHTIYEQIEERKKEIKILKALKAKGEIEERIQREAIKKLEADLVLLDQILTKQKIMEAEVAKLENFYTSEREKYRSQREKEHLLFRKDLDGKLLKYKNILGGQLKEFAISSIKIELDNIYNEKLDLARRRSERLDLPMPPKEVIVRELNEAEPYFLAILDEVYL